MLIHVFYEFNINRTLPTNPITEGADAGWGLALASKEKTARVTFIISGILSLMRYVSRGGELTDMGMKLTRFLREM